VLRDGVASWVAERGPFLVKAFLRRTPLARHVRKRRAIRALHNWTARDAELAGFYRQFVREGDLCFDVGANVGERTKVFLRLGASVVAIEPQLECVAVLRAVYHDEPRLTVVSQVMGERRGVAELLVGDSSTLSTLSPEWAETLRASGRFAQNRWRETRVVDMAKLDDLISVTGEPAFIKIDVEGSEYRVLSGLSHPVAALSFEFVSEFEYAAVRCLDYLATLGPVKVNYTLGERLQLAPEWVSVAEMKRVLAQLPRPYNGDIYARFANL